jgi:hypothetical protein
MNAPLPMGELYKRRVHPGFFATSEGFDMMQDNYFISSKSSSLLLHP